MGAPQSVSSSTFTNGPAALMWVAAGVEVIAAVALAFDFEQMGRTNIVADLASQAFFIRQIDRQFPR